MLLGALIASFLIGPLGGYLGRRYCIIMGAILLIASITAMAVTTSLGALYFSRLLMGISNGFLMNFTFVYIQEIAPPHFRGLSFGFLASWITIGTTIGQVVVNTTKYIESRLSYQIPLYSLYGMPVLVIAVLPFLPESPRWLLLHGKEEQALKSLTWIRNTAYDPVAIRQEFEEMKLNTQHEFEVRNSVSFLDMFRGVNLRRTLIVVGVGVTNAGVGAMFILAFGTYFLKVVGVSDPFKWIIMTNCFGLLGLITSWFFVTRIGRRRIMITGSAICSAAMLALAIICTVPSLHGAESLSYGIIAVTSIYLFGFNFGLAPYTYLTAGELPAQNLRGHTMGVSTGTGFVFAWLTAFTAPYFINPIELNWGGKYGYIWFGSALIVIAFLNVCLPEVRGRTLEEIEEMFNNNVPTWKFKDYVTHNAAEAAARMEQEEEKASGKVEHIEAVPAMI
jgi:SP family sugar:H+ symporter-like MFS transporter